MNQWEGHQQGCVLCGKPLRYEQEGREYTCAICGRKQVANIICPDGHFVCDDCHGTGYMRAAASLRESRGQDPLQLLEDVMALPEIHLNGPEHHILVPCVLLTACANAGVEITLETALPEAIRRARRIPGGTCGYWGVCGAAVGTGIFASVLLGTTPLKQDIWHIPQLLTAACLVRLAEIGGPRCCKRTSRICIEVGAQFVEEQLGLTLPRSPVRCSYARNQRECIGGECPYFPEKK